MSISTKISEILDKHLPADGQGTEREKLRIELHQDIYKLINDIKFPEFWYESNACWGWVRNMEDLKEKLEHQTDPDYGTFDNKDEFLHRSYQIDSGTMNFGTRAEHTGKKTLYEFLIESGVDIDLL